eukprot:8769711-Alexandrium_andersonii.AAC.1
MGSVWGLRMYAHNQERYVEGARTRQGINRELSQDSMRSTQGLNGDCRGAQYVGAQRGAYKD